MFQLCEQGGDMLVMNKTVGLLVVFAGLGWGAAVQAEEAQQDAPGWHVGAKLAVSQSPFKDGDAVLSISPMTLDRDGFFTQGPAFALSASDTQKFFIGAGLDGWDKDRGDSAFTDGMDDLDLAVNVRVGAAWKLGSGVAAAEIAQDVAGAHEGLQGRLRYTHTPNGRDTRLRPFVEVQWLSEDFTDYYVGVDADEARAGRPAYQADADFAFKAGVDYQQPLNKDWTLVGHVNATHFGAEIADSPLIEEDLIWAAGVGLTWHWR